MKKKQNKIPVDPFTTAEKKRRRIRRILTAAVILLIVSAACWWVMPKNRSLKDSSDFDEAEVKAKAEEVIRLINDEDYDALQKMTVKEVRSNMTKEKMDEAKDQIGSDWGEFRSIEKIRTAEMRQRNVKAAVVQVTAEYENEDIAFTLAFNTDMELASFGLQTADSGSDSKD